MRRNVVLPAPFRPSSATRSPRRTSIETPASASTDGAPRVVYTLRRFSLRSASPVMSPRERWACI